MASVPLFHLPGGRVPRQHFFQTPALELGERPRGGNPHGVARLGFALFSVGIKLLGDGLDGSVFWMFHVWRAFYAYVFFTLLGGDFAYQLGTISRDGGPC